LDDSASVLYPGCGNDTSVYEEFPIAAHLDLHTPENLPEGLDFIQGDLRKMDHIKTDSVDVLVLKFFDITVLSEPQAARELFRAGRLLIFGSISETDFETAPDSIESVVDQNQSIRILMNLCENGLVHEETLPNGTAVFTKSGAGHHLAPLTQAYSRNRQLFYEYAKAEFVKPDTRNMFVFLICAALGLNMPDTPVKNPAELQEILKDVKQEAPEEAYRVIEGVMGRVVR
jgi:hypothetical protein